MRCDNCNTFVSFDEPQVELVDEACNEFEASITLRIFRPCAECGDDLSEYILSVAWDHGHECDDADYQASADDFDVSDSAGGVSCTVRGRVVCSVCNESMPFTTLDLVPYRDFEAS